MKNKIITKLNQVFGLKRSFLLVLAAGLVVGTFAIGHESGGGFFGESADAKAVRLLIESESEHSQEEFDAASPNAKKILSDYANDSLGGLQRERAILALSHWSTPDTLWIYRRAIKDSTITTSGRQLMMVKAAETFGPTMLEDLRVFLDSEDVQMRVTAVVALSKLDNDAAAGLLDAHAKTETSPVVLRAIEEHTR